MVVPAPVAPLEARAVERKPPSDFAPIAPLPNFTEFGGTELRTLGELPATATREAPLVASRHATTRWTTKTTSTPSMPIDAELFPIFEEEGEELIPQLQSRMREWVRRPTEACRRVGVHAHAAHAQGRRAPGRRDAPGRNGAPT